MNKNNYPIIAIDFGLKRIGIAISDARGIVASSLTVLTITPKRGQTEIIEEILQLISQHQVKRILVGKPQNFDNNPKNISPQIERFIDNMKNKTNLPILTYDESYSTSEVQNMLRSLGQHEKKFRKKIDKISAAKFLQEFLENENKIH